MYVDDIQLQGQVGYLIQQGMTQVNYFLNTHLHFDIAYNDEGLDEKGANRVSLFGTRSTSVQPGVRLPCGSNRMCCIVTACGSEYLDVIVRSGT